MRKPLLLTVALLIALPLHADDGAASIGAGGIILMKREPRISMAKEVLRISPRKVVVDYDFRNDSPENIDVLVAFPIAPYNNSDYYWSHEEAFNQIGEPASESRIASFRLQINGKPQRYRSEVRAILDGHDYASLLRSMKIDPATFGHTPEEEVDDDFTHLPEAKKAQLRHIGLLKDHDIPAWTVYLHYYWMQRFPANQTTHIRHEYMPITGETQVPPDLLPGRVTTADEKESADSIHGILAGTCISQARTDSIYQRLVARPSKPTDKLSVEESSKEWFSHLLVVDWVDFILTTANTWKQPIEDFTLIVDTKPYPAEPSMPISFCGDGPLAHGEGRVTTYHATNFVPTKELRLGFFRY